MHLSRSLTFDPMRSAEVLDDALCALDENTGYVSRVSAMVLRSSLHKGEYPTRPTGRIDACVTEAINVERKIIYAAAILNVEKEAGRARAVALSMVSPGVDASVQVEVPSPALLQGNPPLENTYMVCLHVLLTREGKALVSYGIIKRGRTTSTRAPAWLRSRASRTHSRYVT